MTGRNGYDPGVGHDRNVPAEVEEPVRPWLGPVAPETGEPAVRRQGPAVPREDGG